MLRTHEIDAKLSALRDRSAALLTRHQHTALHLASAPKGDKELSKALAAVNRELAEIQAQVGVLEAARVAAAKHQAAEERTRELRTVAAARDAAIAAARERVQIGAAIEAKIAELRPLLEAWGKASETCVARAVSTAQGCYGGATFRSQMDLIAPAARGEVGGAAEALVAELRSVARRIGMRLDFNDHAFSGPVTVSMAEAALISAEKLRIRLTEAVARKEKALAEGDEQAAYDPARIPTRDQLVGYPTAVE